MAGCTKCEQAKRDRAKIAIESEKRANSVNIDGETWYFPEDKKKKNG